MGKWLERAKARKAEIETEKQTLQDRLSELQTEFEVEKQKLISRYESEKQELQSKIDAAKAESEEKLNAYKSGQSWTDIESRSTVAVGTKVIYFGQWFTCIKQHDKSILITPVNGTYWEKD